MVEKVSASAYSGPAAGSPFSGFDGESREVTVLFADLVGSTSIGEAIGAEALYALTKKIFPSLVAIVKARGGRLAEFSGDGLMALFGGPVALDDAALVACRTAIEIRRIVATTDFQTGSRRQGLQLRIGISTGLAVVGEAGLEIDRTAFGDTVNLAARLQTLAEADQILIEDRTHALVAGSVDVVPLGERPIKGRKARAIVYQLDSVRQRLSRFGAQRQSLPSLIGRSAELDWLLRRYEASLTASCCAGIIGEAGIGKSRLVEEFLKRPRAQSKRVLIGNCLPDGRHMPFLPVLDMLRQAFDIGESLDASAVEQRVATGLGASLATEENVALLKLLFGVLDENREARMESTLAGLRLRELLFAWLQSIRNAQPTVIAFEDVHWMDQASHDLLARLVSEAASPGLLLWTSRADGQPPWAPPDILLLGALNDLATAELVRGVLGAPELPTKFERFLAEKAGGNPLFAEAITAFLLERGDLRTTSTGVEFAPSDNDDQPPRTIQNLIVERVDRLPRPTKTVLQAASILGRRFPAQLLAEVVGQPEEVLRVTLDELAQRAFLEFVGNDDGGTFRFQHALVRDALYRNLLEADRAALHARVGACLERRAAEIGSNAAVPALAHHYSRTGLTAKAVYFLKAAGQAALATYSIDEASRAYSRAIARIEAEPSIVNAQEFADLLQGWMRVLELQGRFRDIRIQAEHFLLRVATDAPSREAVYVLTHYAHALAHAHRFGEAREVATRAIDRALELGDDVAAANARLIMMKIVSKTRKGHAEDRVRQLGSLVLPVAAQLSDSYLELLTLFELANDQMHRGLIREARQSIEELVRVGERRNDPRAGAFSQWMIGWLSLHEGRYEDALAAAEASIGSALTRTDTLVAMVVKGAAVAVLGRPQESIGTLKAVRDEAERNEDFNIVSAVDSALGVGFVLSGRLGYGVRLMARAATRGERTGYRTSAAYGRLTLAEIYVALARRDRKSGLRDVFRNLPFLVHAIPFAPARARRLLQWVEDSGQFQPDGIVSVRINLARGLLAAGRRQPEAAMAYLIATKRLAGEISAGVYLARADAAIQSLLASGLLKTGHASGAGMQRKS